MKPTLDQLYGVIDATWPAASVSQAGPWTIREGQGGGQRVSAATLGAGSGEMDVEVAEAAMRALNQTPLFMIRHGQDDLDRVLEARGYKVVDPVNLYLGDIAPLAAEPAPRAMVFSIWPPLAIQIDIWAAGGIGPGRVAVMDRAGPPKTSILGRYDHTPAASAFVAVDSGVAMMHALEVPEACRRHGVGAMVTRHAARWAAMEGAAYISALCTQANRGANALYTSLGLNVVGQYHYRKLTDDGDP